MLYVNTHSWTWTYTKELMKAGMHMNSVVKVVQAATAKKQRSWLTPHYIRVQIWYRHDDKLWSEHLGCKLSRIHTILRCLQLEDGTRKRVLDDSRQTLAE